MINIRSNIKIFEKDEMCEKWRILMRLLYSEIKKAMCKRSTYFYTMIAMTISVFMTWYCISSAGTDLLNSDGTVTILKGHKAIPIQKQAESVLSGQVTEDKLEEVLKIYQRQYDKTSNTLVYDKDVINSQKLFGLFSEINNKYMKFNEKTYASPDEMPDKLAFDYYKIRSEKIGKMIDASYSDKGRNQKAKKMNASVEIPFSYYEGYSFWGKAFEHYCVLQIIILVIAAFFAAPIFSEQYHNGGDIIFRTTMYGRKSLAICRIAAAELYGILLFVFSTVLFFGICGYYFGIKGLQSSIQMMTVYAISNITFGQALVFVIAGGMVSMVSTISAIIFISVKMKEPVGAEIVSIVFIVGWKAASLFFGSAATEIVFSSFPMSGTEIIYYLTSLNIYRLFKINIWEPYWTIWIGILMSMILFFFSIRVYIRKKY